MLNLQPLKEEDKKDWMKKPCMHPGHNFPNMLVIPPGKVYKHVCPQCGKTTSCRGSNISWCSNQGVMS